MRMKLPQCDREQEVLDALRSGRWASAWGEEIRQHVTGCAVCAEVALVAKEFQREAELVQAELEQPGARLPSAGLVWWKAQLAARRAAERRAAEPIVLVERVAYVLSASVVLGFCIGQWPRIAAWLHRAETPAFMPRFQALPDYSSGGGWLHWLAQAWPAQTPLFLLAASAAAFVTLIVFAAYVVWREE
jgi:hypothetical protein